MKCAGRPPIHDAEGGHHLKTLPDGFMIISRASFRPGLLEGLPVELYDGVAGDEHVLLPDVVQRRLGLELAEEPWDVRTRQGVGVNLLHADGRTSNGMPGKDRSCFGAERRSRG